MKRKINKREALSKNRFRVTIFGSARIKPGDKEYEDVFKLAKAIGERGLDVVTGGGPGVMRAASEGHKKGSKKQSKNHQSYNIGLGIKLPHEQRVNPYVDIKAEFTRFSERLDNFMLLSNVIVVAPGGVGTILELFFSWQLMQVKHMSSIPIILLGKQWRGLMKWLAKAPLKSKFFSKEDLHLLFYAKNYKKAMKMIDFAHEEYKKGSEDFCINYGSVKK